MASLSLARVGLRAGRAMLRTLLWLLGANLLCFVLLFVLHSGGGAMGGAAFELPAVGTDAASSPVRAGASVPLLFNAAASGAGRFTETLLFDRGVRVLWADFGEDARGRVVIREVLQRIGPSVALVGVPALLFVVTVGAAVLVFILIAARNNPGFGVTGALMMALVFAGVVLAGYVLVAGLFAWFSSIGFGPGRLVDEGRPLLTVAAASAGLTVALWWRQVALLPALIGGAARAARARGLPEMDVCLRHGVVCALPAFRTPVLGLVSFLFMLSLMLETLFEVPGLGQYAIEAFHVGDVFALHSVIFLGVFLHLAGLNLAWLAFARFERPVVR